MKISGCRPRDPHGLPVPKMRRWRVPKQFLCAAYWDPEYGQMVPAALISKGPLPGRGNFLVGRLFPRQEGSHVGGDPAGTHGLLVGPHVLLVDEEIASPRRVDLVVLPPWSGGGANLCVLGVLDVALRLHAGVVAGPRRIDLDE
eukprot:12283706-Heterocapsa_arctica.AAC.1